jgi:hypothetical protein
MRRLALGMCCSLLACGPAVVVPPHDAGPSGGTPPPTVDPTSEARRGYQNPGGMWPPGQMTQHVVTLRELGMKLDPQALTDPMAFPLGAVVSLGGCSASFVSPDGLIITNHHCATGALQFNSTPEQDLLHGGYLAKSRADEKSNGPAARVYVTQAFHDVTKEVRAGLEIIVDPKKRYDTIEQRQKELIAKCEKDRPELRCNVVSFFDGDMFMLIEQLEIRDVRLVYSPAEGIGNFGGEIDNWRWPRHTGDFTFFRAYVGADGKPADFAADNVPYKPKYHLEVASRPLGPRDLVFVTGYPGRTSRLKTAAEVAEAVDWFYPRRIKLCEDYMALLERIGKDDKDLEIKGRALWRGLANALTNTKGQVEGLTKGGLKDKKTREEQALRAWGAEHPDMAVGAALDQLAAAYTTYRQHRDEEAATQEAVGMSAMLSAADTIVHMALERPKPDAERDPAFQERNHKRMLQGTKQAQQTYARQLDLAKLRLALLRAAALPQADRPKLLSLIVPKGEPTAEAIGNALDALYAKTKLEDADTRVKLLSSATIDELKKSDDPFIKLALVLRPTLQAYDDNGKAYQGETLLNRVRFVTALRAKAGGVLAPDANGTLRITYGTVRGYKPKPDAKEYFPFTRLREMVAKATGKDPFDAPERIVEAAKKGPFAPYVDPELGEVPVDFLSDLDITGGNSGSPTLNAQGELVGLVFDGNYESMASDWQFMPEITRAIHVDIRYVLWIMDAVDHAHDLMKEMGVKPSFQ